VPQIVPYDPDWPRQAAAAIAELLTVVSFEAIEHIGSTAVPGMAAKPTIDLMAASSAASLDLESLGYQQHFNGMTDRLLYFRFQQERRTHILHVVSVESWPARNQRILRDYLRQHPDEADRYSRLKYQLADSADYTRAKTDLIQDLTDRARAELGLPSVAVWEKGEYRAR
jgi:GrpB-like predicted nucleotidyltransferase (UPF0157 family)